MTSRNQTYSSTPQSEQSCLTASTGTTETRILIPVIVHVTVKSTSRVTESPEERLTSIFPKAPACCLKHMNKQSGSIPQTEGAGNHRWSPTYWKIVGGLIISLHQLSTSHLVQLQLWLYHTLVISPEGGGLLEDRPTLPSLGNPPGQIHWSLLLTLFIRLLMNCMLSDTSPWTSFPWEALAGANCPRQRSFWAH